MTIVDVLLDPLDEAALTHTLLDQSGRSRRTLIVHPSFGQRALARTILATLRTAGGRASMDHLWSPRQVWNAAAAWAKADRVSRVVLLRAHLVDASMWAGLRSFATTVGADVLMVCHRPEIPAAWQDALDRRSRVFHRVEDVAAAYGWDLPAAGPVRANQACRYPPVPPWLPTGQVLHWRADVRRYCDAKGFAAVDELYGRGLHAACAWVRDRYPSHPYQRGHAPVQTFLTELVHDCPTPRHTLALLRGAQAGFLLHGWWLTVPIPGKLLGPGLSSTPVTAQLASRIREGAANPVVAAGVGLSLATGLPPEALRTVTVEGFSRSLRLLEIRYEVPNQHLVAGTPTTNTYRTDLAAPTRGVAVFYLPLQLRALLRAALEFVARQGHLERCPNTDAHHRLFSHLSRPAGTIRAAARRCGVTLPSASGDLTGTWQIRLSWDGLGGSLHHDGRRLLSGRRLTCEAEVAAAPDTAVVTALHHDEADRTGWRWSLLEPKPLAVPLLVFSHVLRPRHGVLSGWPSPTRWVADELVRRHLAVRVPADGAGREGPGVVVHPDILFALRLSDRAAPSRPDDLGCDQIPDELLAPMGSGAGLAPAPSLCARAFESPQRPVSVLGQAVRPFPGETSESYGRRLSEVNGLRARELRRRAGMAEHHRDWSADLFAAVTGMPADVFTRAMPEVRAVQMTEDPGVEDSDRLPLALYHRRRACVRCAADHGAINDITILTSDDHSVCHRHEVWIGEMPDERGMQVDVSGLPAVIAASAEHRDLTARYGPVVTDQSFRTVGKIIRHWLARGIGPFVWFDRLDQLTDSVNGVLGHRDPLMPIVTYPEKVKITAMVVPSERARFHGADLAAVKAELCSRTSCPDLKLIAAGDPLLAVLRGQIGVDSPFRQNPR